MWAIRAVLVLAILLMPSLAAAEDTAALHRMNGELVAHHVVPRYAALAESTAALAATAETACAQIDAAGIEALRRSYNAALDGWIGVQHLRFGPIQLLMRDMRFAFWPDAKNMTSRHLAEMIAARDTEALAPEAFARGSIAVQGFPALERLLYEEGAAERQLAGDAEAAYRCALIEAIAGNLATMAAEVLAAWRDGDKAYARTMAAPGEDNPYYRDDKEVALELFKSLYTALNLVADVKLARPLSKSLAEARPRLAESWRSGRSLRNVVLNLEAARDLYAGAGGHGFGDYVRNVAGDAALDDLLTRAFAQTIATAEGMTVPLEAAVADPAQRPALEKLARESLALKQLVAQRMPAALGLQLGFNALDGD